MGIHNAGDSGVERSGDPSKRTTTKRANRTRHGSEDRAVIIEAAVRKLVTRELDSKAEVEETAKRLLATGFLSA